MGFTWIFGFAAALGDVIALWYVFIVLNSCQGLLVFLSFVCNRKVGRLWLGLLCRRRGGPGAKAAEASGDTSATPPTRTALLKQNKSDSRV